MFGLVDYQSDGDSEDASNGKPEQQQAGPPSTTAVSQPSTIHPLRTSLPDAASLFSSSVDSSMPWTASRPAKRVSSTVQAPPAKSAKHSGFSTASSSMQHKQNASGLLMPPQLQGRANASTEDMERIGFSQNRSAKKQSKEQISSS